MTDDITSPAATDSPEPFTCDFCGQSCTSRNYTQLRARPGVRLWLCPECLARAFAAEQERDALRHALIQSLPYVPIGTAIPLPPGIYIMKQASAYLVLDRDMELLAMAVSAAEAITAALAATGGQTDATD